MRLQRLKIRPTQPILGFGLRQQLIHKFLGLLILQKLGILDLGIQNLLIDLNGVLRLLAKGHIATQKLKHTDAQGIQIHREVIPLPIVNDLGGHVVRRADDRVGFGLEGVLHLYDFGGAEVDELWVAFHVDDEVFGFEVAVDHAQGREVLQDQDHAADVELAVFGAQQADLPDYVVELLAADELDQRV